MSRAFVLGTLRRGSPQCRRSICNVQNDAEHQQVPLICHRCYDSSTKCSSTGSPWIDNTTPFCESQNRTEFLQKHRRVNRVFFHIIYWGIWWFTDISITTGLYQVAPEHFLQLDWYLKGLAVDQTGFARKENQISLPHVVLFCVWVAQIKCDGALNAAATEQYSNGRIEDIGSHLFYIHGPFVQQLYTLFVTLPRSVAALLPLRLVCAVLRLSEKKISV